MADRVRRSAGASTPGSASLIAGFGLLLLFAYSMVWLGVFLGMNVPTVEVGQQVIFTGPVPDHVRLDGVRPARRAADVAPADRRVEPDQHPDELASRAVGQPEPERRDQPGDDGADPGHARLGGRPHLDLRTARPSAATDR